MIALTSTLQRSFFADHWTVVYSNPQPIDPPAEEPQESPDDSLFMLERFKGPPPNNQNKRMQRTFNQPLVKRRNHCNIARPRFNLPRLKRQRAMRLNTSSR